MIDVLTLIAAGIAPTQAKQFAEPLLLACTQFHIDTPLRQAYFIGQCAWESKLFASLEESLFYRDPQHLKDTFHAITSLDMAKTLVSSAKVNNSRRLANAVYSNRLGNGGPESNNGWDFRGSGLIHLTGLGNFTACARDTGRPYVKQPELLRSNPMDAALSAAWYWWSRNLNAIADNQRVDAITEVINPAMMHADERRAFSTEALFAFNHYSTSTGHQA